MTSKQTTILMGQPFSQLHCSKYFSTAGGSLYYILSSRLCCYVSPAFFFGCLDSVNRILGFRSQRTKYRTSIKFDEQTNAYVYHGFCCSNRPPRYVVSNFPSAALQLISNFRHVVAFGALLLSSLIELSISTWITAKYNANHNAPTSSAHVRVSYLFFMSIWTIVFGSVYLVGFLIAGTSIFASMAPHFFLRVLFYSTYHDNFSFHL